MRYIFLLNMGGANNLDECGEFLKNMFADPNILRLGQPWRWLLGRTIALARRRSMQENYRQIGGKSRLSELERSLCEKMTRIANATPAAPTTTAAGAPAAPTTDAAHTVVDFISAYVPPRAPAVLANYRFAPDDEVILLPLYPHFSTTTTRSSLQDFARAFAATGAAARLRVVPEFFADAAYSELLLAAVRAAKTAANADVLIISAHSLPESIVRAGDPYERQIREHAAALTAALAGEFAHIELAFQSKLGPVKWLAPSVAEVLSRYAGRRVCVLPLSFCIDCSETDFELAIEYAAAHRATGGSLAVVPCCNDQEAFARYLLGLIERCAIELSDYRYE